MDKPISNRRIRKLRRWERVFALVEKRPTREVGKTEAAYAAGKRKARRWDRTFTTIPGMTPELCVRLW